MPGFPMTNPGKAFEVIPFEGYKQFLKDLTSLTWIGTFTAGNIMGRLR